MAIAGLSIFLFLTPLARFYWDDWMASLLLMSLLFLTSISYIKNFEKVSLRQFPFSIALFCAYLGIMMLALPYKEGWRMELIPYLCILLSVRLVRAHAEGKILIEKAVAAGSFVFSCLYVLMAFTPGQSEPLKGEFILNSHVVSAMALLGVFTALDIYLKEKNALFIFLAAISLVALGLTKSVSGYLGLAVGCVILLSGRPPASRLFFKRASALAWLAPLAFGAFLIVLYFKIGTLQDRFLWLKSAAQILIQNPLFGAGAGSFERLAPSYNWSHFQSPYAHSFPLQILCEFGMIAGGIVLLYILSSLKSAPASALKAGLIAAFIQNSIDFAMNIPGFLLIYFVMLACAQADTETSTEKNGTLKNLGIAAVLSIGCVLGWELGVKPFVRFQKTEIARRNLEEGNLDAAKMILMEAKKWDPVPAKIDEDLCQIAYMKYVTGQDRDASLNEAIGHAQDALKKNPHSKAAKNSLEELLNLSADRQASIPKEAL